MKTRARNGTDAERRGRVSVENEVGMPAQRVHRPQTGTTRLDVDTLERRPVTNDCI